MNCGQNQDRCFLRVIQINPHTEVEILMCVKPPFLFNTSSHSKKQRFFSAFALSVLLWCTQLISISNNNEAADEMLEYNKNTLSMTERPITVEQRETWIRVWV